MYLGSDESVRAAKVLRVLLGRVAGKTIDVVVCPSFPSLRSVQDALRGSRLALGAQDVHHELSGPYTGDVPVAQLKGLVQYAIVGHSERRQHHGETDTLVAQKVLRVLSAGFHPVICVGETAEERDGGKTVERVAEQSRVIFQRVPGLSLARCVVAYEPIWAIGSGPDEPAAQPDPEDVVQVMGLIRRRAADHAGQRYAERLRVVYGGSVRAEQAAALAKEPGVDGFLVGGASTKPAEFAAIVKHVASAKKS